MEAPSGHLPSERHTPVGSSWAGVHLAADRCLWMRPLALMRRGAMATITIVAAEAMGTKAVHTGPAVLACAGKA